MKHGEGMDVARDLYIHEAMSFDEIARRIGRSDKTIRVWAEKGGWKERREALLLSKGSVHEKLYTVIDRLADSVIRDCDGGNELDAGRLYTLKGLIDSMAKLQRYEKDEGAESDEPQKNELTPEELAAKVAEVMGA